MATINDIIKAVYEENADEPDIGVIAEKVLERLVQDNVFETEPEALIPVIRSYISNSRYTRPSYRRTESSTDDPYSNIPNQDKPKSENGTNRSARWETARQIFSVLHHREFVNGSWKFLADCTVEDLEDLKDLSEARYETAESYIESAKDYEKLAKLLEEYNATTVKELPEEVLETLD